MQEISRTMLANKLKENQCETFEYLFSKRPQNQKCLQLKTQQQNEKVLNNSTVRKLSKLVKKKQPQGDLIKKRTDSVSLFQRAQVVNSEQRDLLFIAKWLHLPFPEFYCGYSFNFSLIMWCIYTSDGHSVISCPHSHLVKDVEAPLPRIPHHHARFFQKEVGDFPTIWLPTGTELNLKVFPLSVKMNVKKDTVVMYCRWMCICPKEKKRKWVL